MIFIALLLLYFLIVLGYTLTYFFITYHLVKYSLHPSLNTLILPVFIIGSAVLLISNVAIFFSINWREVLSFALVNINIK